MDLNDILVSAADPDDKYAAVVKALLPDDIRQRSDLTERQVQCLAYLLSVSKRYELAYIAAISQEFLTLRISCERKSRGEFVNAFNLVYRKKDGENDNEYNAVAGDVEK